MPLGLDAEYGIRNYCPVVKGAEIIESVDYDWDEIIRRKKKRRRH